jgi:hypothetical protein
VAVAGLIDKETLALRYQRLKNEHPTSNPPQADPTSNIVFYHFYKRVTKGYLIFEIP